MSTEQVDGDRGETTDRPAQQGDTSLTPTKAARAEDTDAADRRMSRAEMAYYEIAERLADLRFAPGSRFTEAEVAADLGMSKTPVREALLMHVSRGLVTTRPGAGYIVVPITVKDVRSLFAHWRRLAGDAAVLAAKRGLDSYYLIQLDEAVAETPAIAANRFVFHLMVSIGEDTYIHRDFEVLGLEIQRLLTLVLSDDDTTIRPGLEQIIVALTAGDTKASRSHVLSHIDRIERLVLGELLSGDLLLTANKRPSSDRPRH